MHNLQISTMMYSQTDPLAQIAGYFAGQALGVLPGLTGAFGFALGLLPAILLNRRMMHRHEKTFRIVSFAQEN